MSAAGGGGQGQPGPPINNLLQPDLYNRLDAQALERTRVVNSQLDQRLRAQHRLLAKYRLAADRHHRRERERVRRELTRLGTRLPAVSRIPDFRHRFLYGDRVLLPRSSSPGSGPDSPGRGKKIRGGVGGEERCPLPNFCERFFLHHLPGKKKYYGLRAPTPTPPPPGGGGGGGDGEGGAAPLPDVSDGDVPASRASKMADSVQPAEVTCPKGADCSGDAADVVISRSRPDDQPSSARKGSAPSSDLRRVRNDNRSPRHSGQKGREPDRKSPRVGQKTSLPPVSKRNVRLARSSPSLFQG